MASYLILNAYSYAQEILFMRAFSLVELSIVLVILGLLTGGILAGQSLIRAAELRSVVSEHQRYTAAINSFRDKYMGLPGDITNATRFWNRAVSSSDCAANSAATVVSTGTCDGNGNGIINNGSASAHGENFDAWVQLALAGLVEGSYTGVSGSGGSFHALIGTNIPASKLNNGSWMYYQRVANGDTNFFTMDNAYNVLQFGAASGIGTNYQPALRPAEAWNIDTKVDDGKPTYGRVIAIHWDNMCSTADSGAANSTNTNLAASYYVSSSNVNCALLFR